jgi:hypothetical protein
MAYTLDIVDTNIEHNLMEVGMDARLELRIETGSASTSHCCETTCTRCGGLMVGEFCMDLLNGIGELEFLASRCVLCGEVVDPVILKNRRIQRPTHQESIQRRRTT